MMADQDECEDVDNKMDGPREERTKEIYKMIQSVESRMEKLAIETCAVSLCNESFWRRK